MKTVNLSLLATFIAASCASSAFAASHEAALFMSDYHEMGQKPYIADEWDHLSYNQQQEVIAANPDFIRETRLEAKEDYSPILRENELASHNLRPMHTTQDHLFTMAPGITKESNPAGHPTGQFAPDDASHWTMQPGITKESNPEGKPTGQTAPSASATDQNRQRTQPQVDALNTAQNKARMEDNRARTSSQHVENAQPQERLTEEQQTARDNGQDLAINDAHATATRAMLTANKAQTYATDIHQQVMVLGGDVDTNTKTLAATSKTVNALGDVNVAKRYQGMINAKNNAVQESADHIANAQEQKIEKLTVAVTAPSKPVMASDHTKELKQIQGDITKTSKEVSHLSAQQRIDSTYYGEQIQHLTNNANVAQKRVVDNTASINKLNSNFSALKDDVDDNRKDANAGIASAMAFASQPQVKDGDTMMVSAGAGTFNGQSAVSVGASFNAGDHTVIKAGVTADTQSDFGAGAGIGYSF